WVAACSLLGPPRTPARVSDTARPPAHRARGAGHPPPRAVLRHRQPSQHHRGCRRHGRDHPPHPRHLRIDSSGRARSEILERLELITEIRLLSDTVPRACSPGWASSRLVAAATPDTGPWVGSLLAKRCPITPQTH